MPAEYVLYLRKSKGRAGIARQRTVTTAHIQRMGGTIVAEFTDTDRTAFQKVGETRPRRDDFDAMLEHARSRPGVGIAAWHADRLTRNDEDTAALISACAAGAHLIETPGGGTYDLATATGRKRLRDDASNAIYEVDHNRERIMAQKTEARAAGEWLGGRRPFGWEREPGHVDGEPVRLRLRPDEAQLIRDGTRDVLAGASLAHVARTWNAAGVPSTGGRPWTPSEAGRALRRARNAGLVEHGGQITGTAVWPQIVTEAQWRRCVAVLSGPARRTSPGNQPRWLLSGIATCGVCGTPVIVNRVAGKGRPMRAVYRDRPLGGHGHVGRDVASLDLYISEAVIAWVEKHGQKALAPRPPDLSLLDGELAAARASLARLDEAVELEQITTGQAITWAAPLNRQVAAITGRIQAAATASATVTVFTTGDIRAGWHAAPLEARRAVVRAVMDVTILPSPRGRPAGHRPGESYFRPETIRIDWKAGE